MKKTLIALLALGSMAMADDVLTSVDQWTFDENLESAHGRTFSTQQVTTNYTEGALELTLKKNGTSGIYLPDPNGLGLASNWALQLTCTISLGNPTGTAQVLACLDNKSDGTQLAIANTSQSGVYGFAVAPGFKEWDGHAHSNIVAAINTPMVLTLMNYNGALYLAQDDKWATFGTEDSVSVGSMELDKLTLGFGQNGENGLSSQTIMIDNLSVYQFDPEKASVTQVKSALMSNIPEPTTGTLSLLALAGLCIRRRK